MKRIKKIKAWLFGVQYRLTVIVKGKTINHYGINRRLLTKMGKNTLGAEYWSLYKTGPFGLPEREVDFGFGYSREEAEKE